jgi:hypothetical protein
MKVEVEFVFESRTFSLTKQCQNLEQEIKNVQWQPAPLKIDTSVSEILKWLL